jgi:hypothetical protein
MKKKEVNNNYPVPPSRKKFGELFGLPRENHTISTQYRVHCYFIGKGCTMYIQPCMDKAKK